MVRGMARASPGKGISSLNLPFHSFFGGVTVASSCRTEGIRKEFPDQGNPPKKNFFDRPEAGQGPGLPSMAAGLEGGVLPFQV